MPVTRAQSAADLSDRIASVDQRCDAGLRLLNQAIQALLHGLQTLDRTTELLSGAVVNLTRQTAIVVKGI